MKLHDEDFLKIIRAGPAVPWHKRCSSELHLSIRTRTQARTWAVKTTSTCHQHAALRSCECTQPGNKKGRFPTQLNFEFPSTAAVHSQYEAHHCKEANNNQPLYKKLEQLDFSNRIFLFFFCIFFPTLPLPPLQNHQLSENKKKNQNNCIHFVMFFLPPQPQGE